VSAAIAIKRALLAVVACGLAAALFARPAAAALCAIDSVPGATLLYPIFELDLDSPATHDTVLSVQNVGDSAVIAHVTLWTDWAVPILDFDVYLARFDVQTIDMKDVILDGVLPVTGSAVSPHGPLAGPRVAFPGCNGTTTPGGAPVYQNPALNMTIRAHVQAALTGGFSQVLGGCAGSNRGNRLARGYVTIDANGMCSILFPSSPGYFTGPATRRNVLVGDLTILRPVDQYAIGFPAVALEAAPEGQSVPGGRTFYGRYVGGSGTDAREPLPTVFEGRYFNGGVFNGDTDFFVWRETGNPPATVQCGNDPSWAPLATQPVAYFDEQEHVTDASQSFPIALDVQATTGHSPYFFGNAVLDLQHAGVTPLYGSPKAQAWAGWFGESIGRYGGSMPANHLPVSCTP
jgi:hypothetical protein